ncbi:sigma-70 family RNA polymerase sigma factor [Mangrovivirga sp. M17]|uniref:Sigma-70 family RNA polymerase sigma factor n=1 Tax=Mangrovivirga halotolerans TaxID=2993936 RepID=A0ABT3RMM4_9BACT|nr:sigma-70 family RNA polymerase sigma factor [Mangrovivirga halotolerans]MCX2742758.1 sigma-70 family RNA polymerase sigma factor [Mangrovivirga halotolerans]
MKIDNYKQAEEIWINYQNGLKGYLVKKTGDQNVANDLTQEVLIKLYNSCCSDIEIKNIRSWIFQITHNLFLDSIDSKLSITSDFPDKPENSEDDHLWKEMAELVLPLLGLLPEKYSVPLKMADIDGMKQSLIASKLNLTLTATKSRIQRGRVLLKDQILSCCKILKDNSGRIIEFKVKDSCTPLKK